VLRGRFNVDTPFVPTDASAVVVVVTVWEDVDDESQRGGRGVIIKKQ